VAFQQKITDYTGLSKRKNWFCWI